MNNEIKLKLILFEIYSFPIFIILFMLFFNETNFWIAFIIWQSIIAVGSALIGYF